MLDERISSILGCKHKNKKLFMLFIMSDFPPSFNSINFESSPEFTSLQQNSSNQEHYKFGLGSCSGWVERGSEDAGLNGVFNENTRSCLLNISESLRTADSGIWFIIQLENRNLSRERIL